MFKKLQTGFTLIELLVVMGIIAVLISIVAVAVNPGQQFARARDTQRRAHLNQILTAIYQYVTDNNGKMPTTITTTPTHLGTSFLNLTSVLVPTYLDSIPQDPSNGTATDTQYILFKSGNKLVASASAETTAGYITLTR